MGRDVNEALLRVGMELVDGTFNGTKQKAHLIDKDGYEYFLSFDSIADKRTRLPAKFAKRNPYTLKNLKNFIKLNNLNCELLATESPKDQKEKLPFRCACGNIYYMHYNHLLTTMKDTCNECGYKRDSRFTNEYVGELLAPFGYKIIDGTDVSYRSICVEDEYGYRYKCTVPNLAYAHTTPIKFHKLNPYTAYNMKKYLCDNNIGVRLLLSDETPIEVGTDYMPFECCECHNTYMAQWGQVVSGGRIRCERCERKQSTLSYMVEQYLLEREVLFVKEYRFNDCRNKRALPFDFYLPKHNAVIEVHGGQHYYQSPIFEQKLEERQRLDAIKENYCKDNGIQYLAIPEWWIRNNHSIKRYKQEIDNIIG